MAVIIQPDSEVGAGHYDFNRNYVYLISAIAALGGVLFGFDLVIISGTVSFFSQQFQLNEFQTGWAVGCINLGAAIGAILAGKSSDTLGRKKLLMLCAILFALTGIGTGWAGNFAFFVGFRMLSGVAVGAAALVCPIRGRNLPCPNAGKDGFVLSTFYRDRDFDGLFVQLFALRRWRK